MSKTPQDFYNQYNGKRIDYDGSYGVQCVDGFKVFCEWAGVPVKSTGNNYASGYWIYRNSNEYSKYFDFITDKSQVRRGDWCIWNNHSSCDSSHIAMYWSPYGSGKATFFGQRQGGNREFRLTRLPTDFMGAFRWKGFTSASGKSIAKLFEGETYKTTAVLRCRKTPGGDIVGTFDEGATVTLAGDHKDLNGKPWKCVKGKGDNGRTITGYVSMEYLK